jgi:hypothetical protein
MTIPQCVPQLVSTSTPTLRAIYFIRDLYKTYQCCCHTPHQGLEVAKRAGHQDVSPNSSEPITESEYLICPILLLHN